MSDETELTLKPELVVAIRSAFPSHVVFRIEDQFTSGIPDIVDNGDISVWLEVKHADPRVRGRKIQSRTAKRLRYCYYVVYYERMMQRRTLIIDPRHIDNFPHCPAVRWGEGFDHGLVVGFLKEVHRADHVKS